MGGTTVAGAIRTGAAGRRRTWYVMLLGSALAASAFLIFLTVLNSR